MRLSSRWFLALLALCLVAMPARAAFHLWTVVEAYSSADGSVQFVRMHDNFAGETFVAGLTLTCSDGITTHTFTFPSNLTTNTPGDMLIATTGFGSLTGGVTPDFTFSQGNFSGTFLLPHGTITFSGSGQTLTYSALPTDGQHSITAGNVQMINAPKNLHGSSGSVNIPGGSCCNGATCSLVLQASCGGGTFTLGGVCSPNPCGGPPTGKCCATSGGCTVVAQASCTGAWTQGGTCSPNTCPQPGVCCNGTTCSFALQSACTGTFTAGTGCVAASCQPPQGACCSGVTCFLTVAANCTGPRMSFSGAAACNATSGATTPCCRADYNHTNGLSVADIFDYLNSWFAANLDTDYLNNGAGPISVQDIFSFINAWFAGC